MWWVILIIVFIVILMCFKTKENFQDNLYGQGNTSCLEICTENHPEAARMDLDGDNDVADYVMSNCLKECKQAKSCSTCA